MSLLPEQPAANEFAEGELASYRRLSLWSLAALAAGLLSALALAHPLLWFVPAIAVIVAILALRTIAADAATLTGRSLALLGLALAVGFAAWGVSRHISRDRHLYEQARQVADGWFTVLQKHDLEAAHQLTLQGHKRQLSPGSVAVHYRDNKEAQGQLDEFFEHPPASLFQQDTKGFEFTYRGGEAITPPNNSYEHILLTYDIRWNAKPDAPAQLLHVVLERRQNQPQRDFFWRVVGISNPDLQRN